jgi:protein-disulfide isomerase
MNDEREEETDRRSSGRLHSSRRTFLAATSVSVGAIAGCADSEDGDDANVVDPEPLDDEGEDDAESDDDDDNESDETADDSEDEADEDNETEETEDSDDDGAVGEGDQEETDESEPTSDDSDDTEADDSDEDDGDESTDDQDGDGDDSDTEPDETPPDDESEETDDDDDDSEAEDDGDSDEDDGDEGDDDGESETEDDDGDEDDETDEESEEDEDETDEDGPDLDHASTENMGHSPVLGPDPETADATVIMFDDPACPACAQFEEVVFPDLQAHADTDELSIVWRGMAVIADWSDPALQVQWATYERDVDAFWELREYAFEIQDEIESGDDAVDRLIEHLEETTSLDTDAIRTEAEESTYARRLSLDEDAAAQAGVDATPYFFLFRDGEFRTEIRGLEDYRVFASALEL